MVVVQLMLVFIGMWINCTTTRKLTILRICPTLVNPNHPSYLLYPTDEGVDNLLARDPGGNCIKIGLPGKSILRDYFQENMTSRRPFLLQRISFPGRPIFIQFVPALLEHVDQVRRCWGQYLPLEFILGQWWQPRVRKISVDYLDVARAVVLNEISKKRARPLFTGLGRINFNLWL